jgi:hypothetical protein
MASHEARKCVHIVHKEEKTDKNKEKEAGKRSTSGVCAGGL